jgi:hypothetical protein
VSAEDHLKDTHARDAQLDKSKIQITQPSVFNQYAMVFTKSKDQLTQLLVEHVKTANGQDTFQTTPELNVF